MQEAGDQHRPMQKECCGQDANPAEVVSAAFPGPMPTQGVSRDFLAKLRLRKIRVSSSQPIGADDDYRNRSH